MEDKFFYWGPLLYKALVKNYKLMLNHHNKDVSNNHNLAGILNNQFVFDKTFFKDQVSDIFKRYLDFYEPYYNIPLKNKEYDITGCWINFMKQGDFNPPHIHQNGDFSCVLYLDIPEKLKEENQAYLGTDKAGPGGIQFIYGEDRPYTISNIHFFPQAGDFFIFPANLRHVVYPFKSNCIRISMSANFKLI